MFTRFFILFTFIAWTKQVLGEPISSKINQKVEVSTSPSDQNPLISTNKSCLKNLKAETKEVEPQLDDVKLRLKNIRNFIPGAQYLITFKWMQNKKAINGFLKGENQSDAHFIQIHLQNLEKTTISFDKLHPETPCFKASPLPIPQWLEPICPQSGVCYFMIAMPFLAWDPISVERATKRGRHVLKVVLSAPPNFPNIETVLVYIDKNFNTILEAYALDNHKKTLASFVLKSFKKYNSNSWYLKAATFSCGPNLTYMQVFRWETLAPK